VLPVMGKLEEGTAVKQVYEMTGTGASCTLPCWLCSFMPAINIQHGSQGASSAQQSNMGWTQQLQHATLGSLTSRWLRARCCAQRWDPLAAAPSVQFRGNAARCSTTCGGHSTLTP